MYCRISCVPESARATWRPSGRTDLREVAYIRNAVGQDDAKCCGVDGIAIADTERSDAEQKCAADEEETDAQPSKSVGHECHLDGVNIRCVLTFAEPTVSRRETEGYC